jgi:putative ABC transport system substrate-binding protein
MRRREFIALLGGAAASWPHAAHARQADKVARIGMLVGLPENDPEGQRWVDSLLEGLRQLGWKRDANLQIDLRWGGVAPDQMQELAKELVQLNPDVINVTSTPATAAVLRETHTIPVVFSVVSDPVGSGFVQSLARPGGNATGFVNMETSLGGKWLEILKEIAPNTTRVVAIFNSKTSPQSAFYLKSLEPAAATLALSLTVTKVSSAEQIEPAIIELAKDSNTGLVVTPDIFTAAQSQRDLIISLTAQHRIPAIYFLALFVRTGGLVSYGVDNPDLQRRAAAYVDRILRGAKPEDLPVQLPTKFELAINLKTAKALGLTVPPSLLATADEVIE